MSARQYLAARFNPHSRAYTYHNDGEPVRVGDEIKVPDPRSDGWQRARVASIVATAPNFPTKAILGVIDGAAIDEAILAGPPVKADPFRDYVEDTRAGLAGPDLFGFDS